MAKKSSPSLMSELRRAKVESGGFEPPSKQAIQLLSTRLVFVWLSMQDRPKTTNLARIPA